MTIVIGKLVGLLNLRRLDPYVPDSKLISNKTRTHYQINQMNKEYLKVPDIELKVPGSIPVFE